MKSIQSLVAFKTKDKLLLPGLLYEPTRKTKKVALYLHGNGSSSVFYRPDSNENYATALNRKGIAYFPFNNRGAHYVKKFSYHAKGKKISIRYGMAYELIRECVEDVDSAVRFLRKKGYRKFYLMGHSTGANKICVYDHYAKKNPFKKYAILAGGDDAGCYWIALGKKRFGELLRECKRKIKAKKGREIVPLPEKDTIISYQSLFDTINPDGDYNAFPFQEYANQKRSHNPLFRFFKKIRTPSLVVYGEKDKYAVVHPRDAIKILKKETNNSPLFEYHLISKADHGYSRKEHEVAELIALFFSH
jgi:pimeloyl-ACP methyl ester carboxylesterase